MRRALAAMILVSAVLPAPAGAQQPNIVVLLADDLGYGDLACYGHPLIETPNLDRMAREGMRLTSFYAAPSCSPARALLLTGRYPSRTGVYSVYGPDSADGIRSAEITLAEALKPQGYRTACYGKWHLGSSRQEQRPLANGFDDYFGLLYSNDMIKPWVQTDAPLQLWEDEAPLPESPVDQTTLTRRYTERAVRFIHDAAGAPFFLYVPYSMVHLPVFASREFKGQSRAGLYGDAVQEIDWSVGEILRALKETGIDENTLVVFTSDNGPWLDLPERMLQKNNLPWHAGSPGPFRGWKGSTYEGGVRVPCIARWPGRIPAGQTSPEIVSLIDVFATAAAIGGASFPDDYAVDGIDVLPLLEGKASRPREALFHFRGRAIEAVRVGPWKLRLSNHLKPNADERDTPAPELFHLELDPGERYNRAAEFPETVAEMQQRIAEFSNEM